LVLVKPWKWRGAAAGCPEVSPPGDLGARIAALRYWTTQETAMTAKTRTTAIPPARQREALLDSERKANQDEPRNFKDDALTDKRVHVEPDGTGPTPTETFDAPQDQKRRSARQRR
jgi:hypothetical protein